MAYSKVKLDESSTKSIIDDAQSYENSHTTGELNNIPVSFMTKPGTYIIRIFPDVHNNRTRIARHTFLHFLKFKNPSTNQDVKLRVVNDIRLSKLLESYSDADLGNEKYRFQAKEYSMVLARVYKAPTEDEYLTKLLSDSKRGFVDVLFVLKPRIMKEIQARIGELTPSQLNDFLDIDSKTFALVVEATTDTNRDGNISWISAKVSVTSDAFDMSMPIFPEGCEYEGLESAYIPETRIITDIELSMLTVYLNRLKERNANYIESKTSDGFNGKTAVASKEEPGWDSYSPSNFDPDSPF